MRTYVITSTISGDMIQRVVRMTEAQAFAMQWIIDYIGMEDVTVEEISKYEAEVIE